MPKPYFWFNNMPLKAMKSLHLYPLSFGNTDSHLVTAKASITFSPVTFLVRNSDKRKIKEI